MVTLTGTFTRLDGEPASGTVRVTPSRSPIMDPDGKIVISGPQTFPLDKDGKLTTEIPASNDPDLGPAFTYSIDVNLTHASWKISKVWIPHGSATVDLSQVSDFEPVPGVATRVVTIPADGADGQVLVWDGAGFVWMDAPAGPQGPPGEVTTAALATALAGKITGTGMTVRVDTSVGTRVFLDHPGGSTMLSGDTGWRDISGLLEPGVTVDSGIRFARIRNINGIVHFQGNISIDPATMVGGQIINLPPGWGPGKYGTWGTSSIGIIATFSTISMLSLRGWTNQTAASFSASWPATYPPTTLPGTP